MAPFMPQDILNSIVDQLTDDRPTLKICALISRFFRHTSQTHLYGVICLKIDEEKRNRELVRIFADNPTLALRVQKLELHLLFLGWEKPSGLEHQPLVAILPLLLHLRSLHMTHESNYMLVWKGNGELHDAVLHLFNLSTLSRLSLGCIQDFPIGVFLRRCTQLRALTLTLIYEPQTPEEELDRESSPLKIPRAQLDVLKISTTQNPGRLLQCLMGPSSSIGIDQLRTLEFGRMEQVHDIDECQRALDGCASTLENFTVSMASETLALTIGNCLRNNLL
jgi:hypothetical protein